MNRMRERAGAPWMVVAGGLLYGVAISALSLPLTGQREAFDANPLFYVGVCLLAGALAAAPAPRWWWLAVPALVVGQFGYYAVAYPDQRAWMVFGVVVHLLGGFWLPVAVGAASVYLGHWLRLRLRRPGAS